MSSYVEIEQQWPSNDSLREAIQVKKNLRAIPPAILTKIKNSKAEKFVVGCAAKYRADDLKAGALKHLGITVLSSSK